MNKKEVKLTESISLLFYTEMDDNRIDEKVTIYQHGMEVTLDWREFLALQSHMVQYVLTHG